MKTLKAAVAKYNSISLILRILVGLAVGVVLALVAPGAGWVAEFGSLFVGALKGIAPVLVFVIVASALAQGSSRLDRRFGTVIWLYMLTTFLAAAIAVVTSFLFPVTVVLADAAQSDVVPQGLGEVLSTLLTNFVANPVAAIMNGNYIGILFWACMFGIAMKGIGSESTKTFMANTADAVSQIVRWIINLAPFGIMGLINIRDKDARLTIRDSVGGGALIGEFNQEFYYQFINVDGGTLVMESGTVKILCPSKDNQYKKCAISVSSTAVFNGGEVLTQVTSPGGEKEERYLSRRLQAIRGKSGGSVTINGGTFDRVVLHSAPTPENRGKYELVVNGGFFRQSIALILTGDVYASNFDHLPMQINDAYFMRNTDKLDQCRLVIGGKLKTFYDNNWDYDIFYNDIPGATLDDALSMMDDLIPHLISENGAVFTDVHDGNWYVRGNMRRWVENGGPIMIFQNTSFGVQGSIVRVISNAYGMKEVLLDGEPMEYGERGYSAPQVNTTAESEHQVTFVMYPISSMLRVLGYSYSNEYSTGYIRILVDDYTGQGMVHYPDVPESGKEPFSVTYYINESNVDTLVTMELQYNLMLETDGVKKRVMTGYKGAKVAQWVDRTQTIDTVYLDISQPLVQGDYSSGDFTAENNAIYTVDDITGYWEHEDIWDLTGKGSVPAILGDDYWRTVQVNIKEGYEGYKFDKNNPPKVKIRGLNRDCDNISVRVINNGRSVRVYLASRPSEVIQSAWGTVTGLRSG